MESEIEAKFVNVDHDEIRVALKKLGAQQTSDLYEQKRYIYKQDPDPSTHDDYHWFRLRDENGQNTLTYKRVSGKTIHDVEEIEVEVGDIDKTAMILEQAGLVRISEQHNKREIWHLDGVDIMLDEWPHAPQFIEIESDSEEKVRKLAEALGFEWGDAVFGSADNMYEQHYDIEHGYEITGLPLLSFDEPLPSEIEAKRI